MAISNDNPRELARTVHSMSEFGRAKGGVNHPWWAVAAGVEALVELSREDGPLQEPATVGLQVIAAVFNERLGEK